MDRHGNLKVWADDRARIESAAPATRQERLKGQKGSWDLLAVALVGALSLGYLAGRGSLLFETAANETPFRDRQSFSPLDWAIEDFELRFEEQYTALIRAVNEQTNWQIAQRGPYHHWLAARHLPDSPSEQEQFKVEFEERLRSNRGEWRKLLENTVSHLRGSFALSRAELDLLAFYERLGMTDDFIALYQELNARPKRPAGLKAFSRRYSALIARAAVGEFAQKDAERSRDTDAVSQKEAF
jgi:hypothetical protein